MLNIKLWQAGGHNTNNNNSKGTTVPNFVLTLKHQILTLEISKHPVKISKCVCFNTAFLYEINNV